MISDSPRSLEAPAHAYPRRSIGVGLGVSLVALATLLKLLFIDSIGLPTPFLLYFGGILLATYWGGGGVGAVIALLSAAVSAWLFVPDDAASSAVPQLTVFVLEGLAIAFVTDRFATERRHALSAGARERSVRDKLELVLRGTDEGITLQDGSGRLVYANRLAAELTGCESPEEMLRLPPSALLDRFGIFDADGQPFPPDKLPGRVLLQGGTAEECRVRFRVTGRTEDRWALVRANAVRDEHGDVRFVVNLFRDITAEQAQNEALQVAREWFQIALRSIGDAVITTDERGRVNSLNPVAERLTGWTSDRALQRPLGDVFHIIQEDTREPCESPVERVLSEGVVVGLANHTLLLRPDGSEIAIDDSAAPICSPNGELRGVILVFRDVSGKRAIERREEFLSQATRELNSTLDYRVTLATVARLAVPLIADWCAVDILDAGEVRRLAVAHVDPTKIAWVQEIQRRYPADRNAPRGVHQILRTGKAELLEEIPREILEASARDDEHRRIIAELGLRSYIGVPLMHQGKAFGVITLVMAESNRRYTKDDLLVARRLADRASVAVDNARLFREVERARSDAVEANRAKDEFLAMLGHELRNPLAPICTALDLIRLRPQASHDQEHGVIERQVRHLVRLVDDLLDLSRITRGRVDLERGPLDVAEVVERAVEMVLPAGDGRSPSVAIDVPRGLLVFGDSVRLAQVIGNLLNNSLKYTQSGGHVWITAKRSSGRVVVTVRDDGIGIGRETLRRIFGMFVQEPQALDRARGGLGIGLAIVRGLVLAHGGTVTAHSDGVGKGAEFTVELPAYAGSSAQASNAGAERPSASEPMRILVVDDNEDARSLLAEVLEQLGHEVFSAATGPEALAVATRRRPGLALLDIGLPDMDGYELAGRLKQLPTLDTLHLVATTGYGQSVDRARSQAAGFSAHLVKPVSLESLKQLLNSIAPAD